MRALRTISSIFLILLVLVSSTSFKVGLHFCGQELQSVALFSNPEPCAVEKSLPPCHRQMMANCCDDETVVHKADDAQLKSTVVTLEAPSFISIELSHVLLSEIIPANSNGRFEYFNYDPPLPVTDITVKLRTLLI